VLVSGWIQTGSPDRIDVSEDYQTPVFRRKRQSLRTESFVLIQKKILLAPALAMLAFLPTSPLQANVADGVASYYGERFDGRRTASGVRFDMNAMTAAHRTLAFGTQVTVTNTANGRSVDVIINDRGPFIHGRTIDLSKGAAREIGILNRGVAPVRLQIVRSGTKAPRETGQTIALTEAEQVMMDLF
jgi:rare lipoprotein A